MSPRLRSALVLLVGGAALALTAGAVARAPEPLMPRDFPEYWAAGRVNLRGGNPYHPAELLREQRRADPAREHAVMMWNPPPSLAVYMPLGLLGARWAALAWLGLQLAAVFVACDLLWRAYCPTHRWGAVLVALGFVGTWWLVAYGQNTGLVLLGLAGFLHFSNRGEPRGAGACAALTALKPHLLAVFGVLLIADALTRRGR
ncbi:MAG TPA: glycosyltransferase family 87 protein, partial [Gemmata sp.]